MICFHSSINSAQLPIFFHGGHHLLCTSYVPVENAIIVALQMTQHAALAALDVPRRQRSDKHHATRGVHAQMQCRKHLNTGTDDQTRRQSAPSTTTHTQALTLTAGAGNQVHPTLSGSRRAVARPAARDTWQHEPRRTAESSQEA